MDELILQQNEKEWISALHSGGVELPTPFERDIFLLGVELAGTSYVDDIDRLYESLKEGDLIKLIREPDNRYDEYAIRVETDRDEPVGYIISDPGVLVPDRKLGYIPRVNNKVLSRLMDAGKLLYGVVRHKEMIDSYHKIVIKVYMKD